MFSEPRNETVLVGNLCPISAPHTAQCAVTGTKYDAINHHNTCPEHVQKALCIQSSKLQPNNIVIA